MYTAQIAVSHAPMFLSLAAGSSDSWQFSAQSLSMTVLGWVEWLYPKSWGEAHLQWLVDIEERPLLLKSKLIVWTSGRPTYLHFQVTLTITPTSFLVRPWRPGHSLPCLAPALLGYEVIHMEDWHSQDYLHNIPCCHSPLRSATSKCCYFH